MGRLFGTDGARGVAITELTCETAMNIGRAAALVLTRKMNHKPIIFIGKDTRISSDILEAALCAGICSVGADVKILGVVPTPAVAYLVKEKKADAGIMISASHNSVEFNGIKIFASNGYKLSDETEAEIEKLILDNPEEISLASGTDVGRISHYENAAEDYINHIKSAVSGDFSNMKIVFDCANGSSSATAEKIFGSTGAECIFISHEPDGTNINKECGSTYISRLQKAVVENKADAGFAFDGDADRCLAVDENGELVDGDRLIALNALAMKKKGQLKNDTAVVTVMTNLGFKRFAEANDINVELTGVGDRYVLERMIESGFNIGGEQSGHIIFLDYASTGDGQLSAIKTMNILAETGKKMSEIASVMEVYPQVLVNVRITADTKGKWNKDSTILSVIEKYEKILGDDGRILVRESGTEPLIRIMIEGKDTAEIQKFADDIADTIKKQLGI
ncbi:MAG: phosphoglucosamine mutase [Oscillospiraceae bacterium]